MGLVTLADMKAYLGETSTTYDTFLQEQIDLVSDVVEAYCRRSFTVDTYEQTLYNTDYPAGTSLNTFHFPVASVASIEEDGVVLSNTEYRVNLATGTIIRLNGGRFFIAKETVVTYDAGYATLPTPIRSVIYSLVQERYNKKVSGADLNFGSDVQRISIPGAISIDFDYSLTNNDKNSTFGVILGSQSNILDYYRSERTILGEGKLIYVVAP
jgi:hypothetical protein